MIFNINIGTVHDHLNIVKCLIENGADINVKNHMGWTPLHLAAGYGYLEIVKYLIEIGADFMATNKDGSTPLDVAIHQNRTDVIAFLETYINNMKYHA